MPSELKEPAHTREFRELLLRRPKIADSLAERGVSFECFMPTRRRTGPLQAVESPLDSEPSLELPVCKPPGAGASPNQGFKMEIPVKMGIPAKNLAERGRLVYEAS